MTDSKWIRFKDQMPSMFDPVWVATSNSVGTPRFCDRTDMTPWTHWMTAEYPKPPKPELTPEQEACEEWVMTHYGTDICHAQRMAWHAALAWERGRNKG